MPNEFESQTCIKLDLSELGTNTRQKYWLKFFEVPIKILTKLTVFERYLNDVDQDQSNESFWFKWLKHLQIYCKPLKGSMEIPSSTSTIFIASQQFDLLNTIALAAILQQKRVNLKILANALLQPFSGLTEDIIYDRSQAALWLKQGGSLLVLFSEPAKVLDIEEMIINSKAPVVPIYLPKKTNRWLKYLQQLIPQLVSILSITHCLKSRGNTFYYSIGSAISSCGFTVERDKHLILMRQS